MKINAVSIRRYRTIRDASLRACGGLNVLIGKNNAGKSTFLSAITRVIQHLDEGNIATRLRSLRPADEFTDRDITQPLQIGVEFDLPESVNAELRGRIKEEAPHLERAIEQISSYRSLSFVLAGAISSKNESAFLFVQHVFAGPLPSDQNEIEPRGLPILTIPLSVGEELYRTHQESSVLRRDVEALDQVLNNRDRYAFFFNEPRARRGTIAEYVVPSERLSAENRRRINALATGSESADQFGKAVLELRTSLQENVDTALARETTLPMAAFAGAAKSVPSYVRWLMQVFGSAKFMQFWDRKRPIGREEADALLSLKVMRGGTQRLQSLQATVKALLGVRLDAFQDPGRSDDARAEMDGDDFLVDANGAGVREALRVIIDLELKRPEIVVLEEPEVHLHPGLERTFEAYLRAKSAETQIFLTTHSTNFLDGLAFQNVYLVARDPIQKTKAVAVGLDGVRSIPAELGLRLSTVFMFDRLVFVEGPTDEGVLRALASMLGLDLARANVGFIHMGGVRNFAYYAAEGTLELLSHRAVRMWFLVDRDERDDAEVQALAARLGGRAQLLVLERRELENYLLDPAAVAAAIRVKVAAARGDVQAVQPHAVAESLRASAEALRDEVIRLRFEKKALRPVYLQHRSATGTPEERLARAGEDLKQRLASLDAVRADVSKEVTAQWPAKAMELAPGGAILEETYKAFGARFNKDAGDSIDLAQAVSDERQVPDEILRLIRALCEEEL